MSTNRGPESNLFLSPPFGWKSRDVLSNTVIVVVAGVTFLGGIDIYGCEGAPRCPMIDLRVAVRQMVDGPPMAGPLAEDGAVFAELEKGFLQEIGREMISRVRLTLGLVERNPILPLAPKSCAECATRSPGGNVFLVERTHWGERLKKVTTAGAESVIHAEPRGEDGSDCRHIHSLSVSPSGRYLAFMVSGDNKWCNWRKQSLMIYDEDTGATRRIWQGHISGSIGILNPYMWVQQLPWSPSEGEVLVAKHGDKIVSVDVYTGEEKTLSRGYLPIAVVAPDQVMLLRHSGGLVGAQWYVVLHGIETGQEQYVGGFKGASVMRCPLLSPDGRFISFIAVIHPDWKPTKDIHIYTVIVRLVDFKHMVIKGEITAWTKDQPVAETSGTSTSAPGG